MYGEEYFKNRLIGIYDMSPIKYLSGSGLLNFDDKDYEADWELVVDITGEYIFYIHIYNNLIDIPFGKPIFSLEGISNCGIWKIIVQDLQIFGVHHIFNKGLTTSLTCISKQILLRNKKYNNLNANRIEGLINNFKFLGIEVTHNNNTHSLNKMIIHTYNRDIVFFNSIYESKIDEQIKLKRIDRGLFSTINIPILDSENINEVFSLLNSVNYFLSFINMNSCFCPVINLYHDDLLIGSNINDTITSKFHGNIIIDNMHIRCGIKNIFDSCFINFNKFDNLINLKIFVSNLLGMYEGKFLENKIAGLLISYEYILTKYLSSKYNFEKIKNLDLIGKLRLFNKEYKFITNSMFSDNLRENVRNPLFHTGELTLLSQDEKIDLFRNYYDLLMQIVLHMLDYNDMYISPINYEPKHV